MRGGGGLGGFGLALLSFGLALAPFDMSGFLRVLHISQAAFSSIVKPD